MIGTMVADNIEEMSLDTDQVEVKVLHFPLSLQLL